MKSIYLASGILLAGFVGSVYNRSGSETAPGPTQATAQRARATSPSDSGWKSELCVLASGPADSEGNCEIASQYRSVSHVIVFVPDPYLTRLRLQFDRSIEAITWAAQDAGFTSFRAQWVPWRATEPAELSGLDDRNRDDEDQKQRRKLPGVLVFSGADKSLIVWLVGESPTHGLNREQFSKALAHVKESPGRKPVSAASARPVRIVGPCFSGTLPLLTNALEEEWAKDPRLTVAVLSGTANHTASEDGFLTNLSSHPGSRFNSLSYQDVLRIEALKAYLHGPLDAERSMTVLSEDETAYGEAKDDAAPPKDGAGDFSDGFRFPRGIAFLRNAYQADPGLLLSVQESAVPRRSLQLSLEAPDIGHDSVPEFSEQTPVSAENQVRQIAEMLGHHQTPMAAVIATDVLDTLFIGKFLRISAPNTRLAFMDADSRAKSTR